MTTAILSRHQLPLIVLGMLLVAACICSLMFGVRSIGAGDALHALLGHSTTAE